MDNKDNVSHIFNKYAKQYQDKYMNVDLYKQSLDLFCELVSNDNAQILDIGCGPGNVSQYLLNNRQDFQITGIDLAESMVELAKINNPLATFQTLDCRNINQINQNFDGIMCGFCLPYLNKEESQKLIKDASKMLNKNGILYLSCIQDKYSNSGPQGPSSGGSDTLNMYYYQAEQLINYLSDCGFSLIKSQQLDNPQQKDTSIKDLVLIARNSE